MEGHGHVTQREAMDDITVEDFTGYLNIACTSLYNMLAYSLLCTQDRHTLEHDYSNAMGQALTTISCVAS